MSARELAAKIRTRELTAKEVMAAYIQRCKSIHPMINAMVDERFDEALQDAIAVDKMLDGGRRGSTVEAKKTPLLGVPFTCKEAIGVQGMSQTNGDVRLKNWIAPEDAASTALYRQAGAIPLVVTNVPEGCAWWETANLVFGRTKNPYNNMRSVGGSSGLISNNTPLPYEHHREADLFVGTGPMCRYVEDLPMLTKLLSGHNSHKVEWRKSVDFRYVKIFYLEEFPGWLLSSTNDIKASVRKAAKHFEDKYGTPPTKLNIPELKYAFYISECKLLECGLPAVKEMLDLYGKMSLTWEFIKSIFRQSTHTWPMLYLAAVNRRSKNKFYYKCLEMYKEIERKFEEYLEGDAILLLPTHPDPPPHYLMTIPKHPNMAYTCIFNALGYPVSQVPTGLSKGVPIGIQVASTKYKDDLTLAAAVELDKVFNGWINPSPVAA